MASVAFLGERELGRKYVSIILLKRVRDCSIVYQDKLVRLIGLAVEFFPKRGLKLEQTLLCRVFLVEVVDDLR